VAANIVYTSGGQLIRSSLTTWGLGKGKELITIKPACYEMLHKGSQTLLLHALEKAEPHSFRYSFVSLFIFITFYFIRFTYINSTLEIQLTGLSSFTSMGIWISDSKNG
jgi:hypothetical protein